MVHAETWLKALLRAVGLLMLPAAAAIFMPREWMENAYWWLGLGVFPTQPIVTYLARTLSAMYVLLGGLLWLISMDVRKYDAVLRYVSLAWLAIGHMVLFIGLAQETPLRTYLVADAVATMTACAIFLVLRRRIPRQRHVGAIPHEEERLPP